jgi:hypothetical protein
MKFDSKVKGALAWAGLFVILAVPSADLIFGSKDANANLALTSEKKSVAPAFLTPAAAKAELSSDAVKIDTAKAAPVKTDPVQTASIATPGGDPVDTYISQGKKLPDYISDADTAPAVKPAAPVTVANPVEVATVAPADETPPVPLPRDARPKLKAPVVASVPASPAGAGQPLIIDEKDLAQREASLDQPKQPVEPFPLSDGNSVAAAPADDTVVTGDQLEEWDSGSLADYLARKGLLSDNAGQQDAAGDSEVHFNQGPSRPRRPQNEFFLF